MGGHGRNIDDGPSLPGSHARCDSAAHQHGADKVSIDDRLNVFEQKVERRIRIRLSALGADVSAGAVDQNSDGAQSRLGLGDHGPHRVFLRNVASDGHGSGAGRRHGVRNRRQIGELSILGWRVLRNVVDGEIGAQRH
ncbi:hypothetical protein D3C73_611790 [compost metagenome]